MRAATSTMGRILINFATSKTGVVLKDTGARDEYGMQPLDDLFSSPDKESRNGADDLEDDESDEEPMDIDEVTAPAPSAFMNSRPPIRARSPPKTNLKSPARRAPGFSSSPLRAANVADSPSGARNVQRQLDFKKNNGLLANKPTLPRPNGTNGKGKGVAGSNGYESASSEDAQDPEPEEESMAMLSGGHDYGVDDEEEEEEEPELEPEPEVEEEEGEQDEEPAPPPSAKKSKGRPPKKAVPAPEPVEEEDESDAVIESIEEEPEPADEGPVRSGKKRGRPSTKKAAAEAETQPAKKKAKRTSDVRDEQGESSNPTAVPRPRGRPKAVANTSGSKDALSVNAKKAATGRKTGPKRMSTGVGDTSVAEVPRGPPLPGSRGLFITRRETPGAGLTTRSGRASYQPLRFWANERTERDDDAFFDGKEEIILPHIKNIVRVDEPEPGQKSRRKTKSTKGGRGRKKRGSFYDDDGKDDDLEPWEEDGDVITGEVVVWQPEHELNPPGPDEQIEVATDEQIAVSANAITTREIRGASFKFAKTLSMPFFGSGVVDLPPNSEKKPKNSRKMHMSFFVFAGRVQVTVADTVFSIGRGGMWFVPRGNYYSIENVSDKPARIFFSQGCEINTMANPDASQMAS
ncbi:unnamed protein product [Discula destructiva]